jgi:hypothetical protein
MVVQQPLLQLPRLDEELRQDGVPLDSQLDRLEPPQAGNNPRSLLPGVFDPLGITIDEHSRPERMQRASRNKYLTCQLLIL